MPGGAPATVISSIFSPAGAPADAIRTLSLLVLALTAAIFLIVGGLLAYSIVRYRGARRRRPRAAAGLRQQSDRVRLDRGPDPDRLRADSDDRADDLRDAGAARARRTRSSVRVIGHQWWWEFRYPDLGIVTANELHVPVSDPTIRRRPSSTLESADVAHSFWVPRLAGKTDVIPEPHQLDVDRRRTRPGTYLGQCAEYCGTQHANMLLRVVVAAARDDFERWVAAQTPAGGRRPPAARRPRSSSSRTACINCHTVRGTGADGHVRPRPDSSDEPRDARRRRGAEHAASI